MRQKLENMKTKDARDTNGAQEAGPTQPSGEYYSVSLPAASIRRLARLSPEADRKLRAQVPQAFIGPLLEVAQMASVMYPELAGPYNMQGFHLSGLYTWEIVPNFRGGSTLIARRKL
jgi:hypothetical protein